MTDPLKTLLALPELATTAFPPNSRYHGIETAQRTGDDGRAQVFLRRRFVPEPRTLTVLQQHRVEQGDRLDLLAHAFLQDPELFWQICDANAAMRPDELVEIIGRRLRIAQSTGVT